MATGNTDDLKPVASPLDLSLKIVHMTKTSNDESHSIGLHTNNDLKSVSSEELLSLKLLHDRLSKTMELLLPQEKSRNGEEFKKTPSFQHSEKTLPEFDYRATMKALLSLVESEHPSNDDDEKNSPSFVSAKPPTTPHIDALSYWHDYILSLYLMNSSLPVPPPPIPPPIPPTPLSNSMFPPAFSFIPPSTNSIFFQNMLSNIINRSSAKPPMENDHKKLLLQDNSNQEFGFKSKKQSSYQFLKDSSALYNSLAATHNLGLTKSKLLDSPESFGVSLRGNQKYSIYYQQRPNNIFNNNFLSPTCSSTMSTKTNQNAPYRHLSHNNSHFFNDGNPKKTSTVTDIGQKKPILTNNSNNKSHKILSRNEASSVNSKNRTEKSMKLQNVEHGHYGAGNQINFDTLPTNTHLINRYRETVFNCSCGQEFENLYTFTLHMKLTHHTPNSSIIERCIPKLVRGQDMWINSETEQTKEILRCMRCHQSFRTLPELTMHMVETNHYSEIVYSDSGKCVFLNSDHDKVKQSDTTISSPISSPGNIIRKLKRTLSSSTGSEIGAEEETCKRRKRESPLESLKDYKRGLLVVDEIKLEPENKISRPSSTDECAKVGFLQIKEADSGTGDQQPDSDSLEHYKTSKCIDDKESSNSVIRQIENFVEKSLPKPIQQNEFIIGSSVFPNTSSNHKSAKLLSKCGTTTKSNNVERICKHDSKSNVAEKSETLSRHKEKPNDGILNSFKYRNYHVSSSESIENPLSSLQTLVETIQKTTTHNKDQGLNNCKMSPSQNKDTHSYSYPSKSPIVCDSLSQLQAFVAGTSLAGVNSHGEALASKKNEYTNSGYSSDERKPLFQSSDITDSPAAFLSWCHRLGELLGLPQALSQAMLTQDAIKELTNSVLQMSKVNHLSSEPNPGTVEDNNNNNNLSESTNVVSLPASDSLKKPFQIRELDPIEQLKNLLNSTSDNSQSTSLSPKKFPGTLNQHSATSPPTISKKAKCHFCNKPFANKGQVRLHISKGKCPSLLRSCHSSCNQLDLPSNRTSSSPVNYDTNFSTVYKFKEASLMTSDSSDKGERESNSGDSTIMNTKSVNLIREYFKFAKQMIGNDDNKAISPTE